MHVLLQPEVQVPVQPEEQPPVQVVEHSPVQELVHVPVQEVHLPEHEPEHEPSQLSIQAASQSSQLHDVKVVIMIEGPTTNAPSIGNIPLAAFLKNSRLVWSSLFLFSLSSLIV